MNPLTDMDPLIDISLIDAIITAGDLDKDNVQEIKILLRSLDAADDLGREFCEVEFTVLARDQSGSPIYAGSNMLVYPVVRNIYFGE